MTKKKNTHGGTRPKAGRPLTGKKKRVNITASVSAENAEFLKSLKWGEASKLIDKLLKNETYHKV